MGNNKKYKCNVKLIAMEAVMVCFTIALIVFFVFLAMGYKINGEWKLEQNSLIHVMAKPTDSKVFVDGKNYSNNIGTSRIIGAGKHDVKIEKEGYNTWNKEINARAGVITQLFYVQLIPIEKKIEAIQAIDRPAVWKFSADREKLLYLGEDRTKWQVIDLKKPQMENNLKVDFSEIFKDFENQEGKIEIEILNVEWYKNEKILLEVRHQEKNEWLLLDLAKPKDSVNLTRKLGIDITDMQAISDNTERMMILEKGNLREVRTNDLVMSRILVSDVWRFMVNDKATIYVRREPERATEVGIYREGDEAGTLIEKIENEKAAMDTKVAVWEYFGEDYLVIFNQRKLSVYKGVLPYFKKENKMQKIQEYEIGDSVKDLQISKNGQLIYMRGAEKNIVVDVENEQKHEFVLNVGGFADDMKLWSYQNGKIWLSDFDGMNLNEISHAENVAGAISGDYKWFYFVGTKTDDQGEDNNQLFLQRLELLK